MGLWQTIRTAEFGWHSHQEAYAALVLSGGYEEAGDHGRFRVEAGHVVFHDCFEAHVDRFSASGAVLLNLPLPPGAGFYFGVAKVTDVDAVVRASEKSRRRAVDELLGSAWAEKQKTADWPDELATALMQDSSIQLCQWAEHRGLAPWAVSRGFRQIFGVSPEVFRARARARQAWKRIQSTDEPLASIAAHLGFADQSHMTRSVKGLTGSSPLTWRVSANGFKTSLRRNP